MTQNKHNDATRTTLSPVEVKVSSQRETPNTSFAEIFEQGLKTGAAVVTTTAPTAGYALLPGAAVLGAAVTSAGIVKSAGGGHGINGGGITGMWTSDGGFAQGPATGFTPLMAQGGQGGLGDGSYMGGVTQRAQQGDPHAQTLMATQQMQEMNQAFNLQYLGLQERMQHEGRAFTAMSNVMKSKSDTARNTLSNLK